jgi:hypothetical protein
MPMLFRFSVTTALWLLLCSFGAGALAAPSVSITNILRLQPGWLRVYLQAFDPPLNPQFGAFPTCASPTSPSSITATVSNGANVAIDLKVDPTWLADNGLPAPCTDVITSTCDLVIVLAVGLLPGLHANPQSRKAAVDVVSIL